MTVTAASDDEIIHRTARRIAVQTSVVFATSIIALAAIAALLAWRTQRSDAQRLLWQAIADSDAVTDPPSGIYIYETDNGITKVTIGVPGGAPLDPAGFAAVTAGKTTGTRQVDRAGRQYLVTTGRRDSAVVQAALDLTDQQRERNQLIGSLAEVSAIGLALAVAVGWLIARRAIHPLGVALQRQRQFVADASHELRTPLTRVHTRAQLLRRRLDDATDRPELVDDLDRLIRGTRQLGEIVDELLISAQLRAEPGHIERVDLAAIVADVVDDEQLRATELGISVTAAVDSGTHAVGGSTTALRRVVSSLVDNALGHTATGGHVTVELSRLTSPPRVVCRVRDDGVGFDDRQGERLFDRFARGEHGRGRRYGLGLALVREVIDAHGGTVTAEGVPGTGATFIVTLPAIDG